MSIFKRLLQLFLLMFLGKNNKRKKIQIAFDKYYKDFYLKIYNSSLTEARADYFNIYQQFYGIFFCLRDTFCAVEVPVSV